MSNFVIPTIFTAVDKLTGPINKMSKGLKDFETSSARLERSFRRISEKSKQIAISSAIFGAALITPLVMAGKSAINFEAKMSNIATLVDTNVENMSQMGDQLVNLSTKMPVALDDLTVSLYDIRSAGISASDAMSTLTESGRLSVSGLSTASEATNIMTSAINAFKNEGLSAAQISDILFKTVKYGKTTVSQMSQAFGANAGIVNAAGVKLSEFSAATAALTTVGTPAAQAQDQIKSSLIALEKPTAQMLVIFKKLGVSTGKDLIQKAGGYVEALMAIEEAGKKNNVNMAEAWSRTEALAAVTSLLGSTNESYVASLKDMATGTNAINEAFEKQMKTGKSQAQLAENNMKALSITLGTTLIPVFNELLAKIMPVVQSFMKWSKENSGTVTTILMVVAALGSLSLIVSAVSTVVSVVTGVTAAYGFITKSVTALTWAWQAAQIALNFVMTMNPIGIIIMAIAALVGAIYWVVNSTEGWGEQWDEVVGYMTNKIEMFKNTAIWIWQNIEDGFLTMVDAIVLAWKWAMNSLGFLSDQQYAEDKARIEAEKNARIAAITDTEKALQKNVMRDIQGMQWKIKIKEDARSVSEIGSDLMGVPSNNTPLVNPELAKQEGITNTINNNTNGSLDINIKDPGNAANINSSSIPKGVRLSTTAGWTGGTW